MTVGRILLVSILAFSTASCGLDISLKTAPASTDETQNHDQHIHPVEPLDPKQDKTNPLPPENPVSPEKKPTKGFQAFAVSDEKFVLSQWSSTPNCNGFRFTFNKMEASVLMESCSDASELTFGGYNSIDTLALNETQVADISSILAKLEAVQQEPVLCAMGRTMEIVRVTGPDSETSYDVGSPCSAVPEPSDETLSIPPENLIEVMNELSQYLETLNVGIGSVGKERPLESGVGAAP